MPTDVFVYACVAAGLLSALVAGVFQSFSDFVMRSLVAASPVSGIESMQMINRKVYRSAFLVMLLGLAPATLVFTVIAHGAVTGGAFLWIVAGAAIYAVGVFAVTMLGNVPMNQRLDRMDPRSAQAADYWRTYGAVWTRWNHVRTVASLAAAGCFLMAGVALA